MSSFDARCKNLRALFAKAEIDALLVTNFKNVTYLTGFTGDDSYLLVTPRDETLITDMRYLTQLADECPELELAVRKPGETMAKFVAKVLGREKLQHLGIEGHSATVSLERSLAKALPNTVLVVTENLIE